MATRNIIRTVTGSHQIDGAGVHLVRVVGYNDVIDFDPFLMLDGFDSHDPSDYVKGFPWHPHRGIETVTYLINGRFEHEDSLGNKGVINPGECQWMTAGSGIMHQEMPKASEHMQGFQLWINLPQKDKMTPPRYGDIRANMMPTVEEEVASVRVISGKYKKAEGVHGHYVDATLYDIIVKPGATFDLTTDPADNVFAYLFEGSAQFGDNTSREVPRRTAVLFDHEKEFCVKAGANGVRFAFFAGKPLKEPIAWGGPIVMNTRAELNEAFSELEKGTFIK